MNNIFKCNDISDFSVIIKLTNVNNINLLIVIYVYIIARLHN